jgi:undecaprenyl-diphosphatase
MLPGPTNGNVRAVDEARRGRASRPPAPAGGYGRRLALAAVSAALLAVPFTVLLVLVVDGFPPLHRMDLSVASSLNRVAVGHPVVVTVLKGISTWLGPTTFRVIAVVLALLLLRHHRPRLAAYTAVTVLGGGLLVALVKWAVDRPRPHLPHPVVVLGTGAGSSFPSGHALGVIVGVGTLLVVLLPILSRWIQGTRAKGPRRAGRLRLAHATRVTVCVLAVLLVLAVGFARVGLGVHYVSDVLGGYVLGLAWLSGMGAALAGRRGGGEPPEEAPAGTDPGEREPGEREPAATAGDGDRSEGAGTRAPTA